MSENGDTMPVREPTERSYDVEHTEDCPADRGDCTCGGYVPVAEVELDMGCPFGREGDWLAKAQRISSEALSGRYPNPDRQRS
jgi:hypothetical protein